MIPRNLGLSVMISSRAPLMGGGGAGDGVCVRGRRPLDDYLLYFMTADSFHQLPSNYEAITINWGVLARSYVNCERNDRGKLQCGCGGSRL